MAKKSREIFLIDGSSYIHRAYHAMGGLSNSSGLPTGAVFGFTNMLVKTLKEKQPVYLAVVFDAKGPTFRHQKYAEYKANRPPMPEDLRVQIPYIRTIVDCYRIPSLELQGYEADDIIATLVRQAREQGFNVTIVSGDKDLMQLVGEDVRMWDTQQDVVYDRDAVKKKFGVFPEQLVDMFALTGDSSDNVPGVQGVGPKTAAKLINDFGNLEAIYEHLERISQKKLKENLVRDKELAFLSRDLVRLCDEVPLDKHIQELVPGEQDVERLRDTFMELEFKRLVSELPARKSLDFSGYHVVVDREMLSRVLQRIKERRRVSVDLETTSEQPVRARLVGISLCCEPATAWYIPVGHSYGEQLPKQEVLDSLRAVLEDPTIEKIGQNIKYDLIVLKNEGVEIRPISFDTMLASYLLDPTRRGHSLDDLAEIFLEHKMIPIKDLIGQGKSQVLFSEVDIAKATEYACEDAEVAFRVAEILAPRIEAEGLGTLYREVELPLITVLADMELAGVRIDSKYLYELSQEFGAAVSTLEGEIYALAGACFNINSPKQLAEVD